MLTILSAILLGIVEGITEWLPVSSTAHMMLVHIFFPLYNHPEAAQQAAFYNVFEVVIQLGAILAVVLYFWNRIWPFGKSKRPLGEGILSYVKKDVFFLWVKIVIACIPAAVIGLLFDDQIDALFGKPFFIARALIIVGIIFIVVERLIKDKEPTMVRVRDITFRTALYIGLFQVLAAVFPGTSRSGATIIGALLLGVSRSAAVEFTFELAIPVMAGASLLKLIKYGAAFSAFEVVILIIGMVTAFIVSMLVIRSLLKFIRTHSFIPFGIYRIVLGIVVLIFFGLQGSLWTVM